MGWSYVSDKIGRRNTFYILTLGSVPLYLSIPTLVEMAVTSGSAVPLYAFCGVTVAAISGMGGAYATLPPYEADIFGAKYVGAIHGRMLFFSSLAAIGGPSLLMKLRSIAESKAIADLLAVVDPAVFRENFGAPMESAAELLASKTLTINKLLALAPPGTLDPSPHLYDTTMLALSGLMATSVVVHHLVHKPTITVTAKATEGPQTVTSAKQSS